MTLSALLASRLEESYGTDIKRIFVCGHCRALSSPNENLRSVYEQFEEERAKLQNSPLIKLKRKSRELEIRFATVWPVAEEFRPDSEMLKLGTFLRFYVSIKRC